MTVWEGTFRCLGTDHELLSCVVEVRAERERRMHCTRPRVWVGGPQQIDHIDQEVLTKLARDCTKPRPGKGYRDPEQVKAAVRRAKVLNTGDAWKSVQKLRKQARQTWEAKRIQEATQGDWEQVRLLRMKKNTGWDAHYAEAQAEGLAHSSIHNHLKDIYETGHELPALPPWQGDCVAFTQEELKAALGSGRKGKAVGVDQTSIELLHGICSTPGGLTHLLEFYNTILCTAQIPSDWNKAIMVVIPKIPFPEKPGDLRPLSMGSAAAKVFSRMLLTRSEPLIALRGPEQCSGKGRQCCDFIFVVARLMQLEQEWKRGACWLKVDLAKAFDRVDRRTLADRLLSRMGMGPEYCCWYNLLRQTDAILQTGWDSTVLRLQDGIKQGALESPAFFSFLAETCLHEAAAKFEWHKQTSTFEGLNLDDLLYMDDGLQWSPGVEGLERRIAQWGVVLQEFGLRINAKKCQLYCSPYYKGKRVMKVQGELLFASDEIRILGLTFRVGITPSELVAPLLAQARAKFWGGLRHLLRAKTPLGGRVRLMERILGGTVLWPLAAIPMDNASLGLINSLQLQMCIWMMRVAKRLDETWVQFRERAYRGARSVVHQHSKKRWSTLWLERWWQYSGHRTRLHLHDSQHAPAILDSYRTRVWWLEQQALLSTGIKHPGHIYPKLMNMERDMDTATGGTAEPNIHFAEFGAYATTGRVTSTTSRVDPSRPNGTCLVTSDNYRERHHARKQCGSQGIVCNKATLPHSDPQRRRGHLRTPSQPGDDPALPHEAGRAQYPLGVSDYTILDTNYVNGRCCEVITLCHEAALPHMNRHRCSHLRPLSRPQDDPALLEEAGRVQHPQGDLDYTILNTIYVNGRSCEVITLCHETALPRMNRQLCPEHLRALHRPSDDPALPADDRRLVFPRLDPDYTTQHFSFVIPLDENGNPQMATPCRRSLDKGCTRAVVGRAAAVPDNTADPGDSISLMQRDPATGAWLSYLETLRDKLENMGKEERTAAAGTLLRLVNWHCTNTRDGYLLGHMQGQVGMITALLVAAMDERDFQEGQAPPEITWDLWVEAERHLDQHPGSPRTRGHRMDPGLPCIMLFSKVPPSATPDSPSACSNDQEPVRRHKRTRSITIEVSTNIEGASSTNVLRTPLRDGHAEVDLKFKIKVENQSDDGTSSAEPPADPPRRPDKPKDQEDDDTVMLSVTGILVTAMTTAQAMEGVSPTILMARDQLGRLRREGWTRQQQASALFVLFQRRQHDEYMADFPAYVADLDLDLDVNLAPACLPTLPPVMEWIEAEIWEEFIDRFEGEIGRAQSGTGWAKGQKQNPSKEQTTLANREDEEMDLPDAEDMFVVGRGGMIGRKGSGAASSRNRTRATPTTAATELGPSSMTIIQATQEWFRLTGLRSPGNEQTYPSEALTPSSQREARHTLRAMSEGDLMMMQRALMRLMGMLFIEAAHILIKVHEDRLRANEMVEVDVDEEEDEETSIYMQTTLLLEPRQTWEATLHELVSLGDKGADGDQHALLALRRRITQSLYIQTPRGVQLHAALVAVTGGIEATVEHCDTAQEAVDFVDTWWKRLKSFMELGGQDSGARSSTHETNHTPQEVEAWECERRLLSREEADRREHRQSEDGDYQDQMLDREQEEAKQMDRDAELFESHLAETYKDWENWVLLNTPNQQKRRRLVLRSALEGSPANEATVDLPNNLTALHLTMTVVTEEAPVVPPKVKGDDGEEPQTTGDKLEPKGDLFDKAYAAWKKGALTDEGVDLLFGEDWLFIFQVMKEGVGEDTLMGMEQQPLLEGEKSVTQLDGEDGE
ncbi:pol [Symbiodinium sp. CCMP2456]|nr:pol [Symbiodinium sp. CCMP2456]